MSEPFYIVNNTQKTISITEFPGLKLIHPESVVNLSDYASDEEINGSECIRMSLRKKFISRISEEEFQQMRDKGEIIETEIETPSPAKAKKINQKEIEVIERAEKELTTTQLPSQPATDYDAAIQQIKKEMKQMKEQKLCDDRPVACNNPYTSPQKEEMDKLENLLRFIKQNQISISKINISIEL